MYVTVSDYAAAATYYVLCAVSQLARAAGYPATAVSVDVINYGGSLGSRDHQASPSTGRAQRHGRGEAQGSPLTLRQLALVLQPVPAQTVASLLDVARYQLLALS